jgi:hypothetical protein
MRIKKQKASPTNEPFVSQRGQKSSKKREKHDVASSLESTRKLAKEATKSAVAWRANLSINNLEQEKRQEVDKEIREKNKLRKRRRTFRLTLKLGSLLIAVVGLYLLICSLSKRVSYSDNLPSNSGYSKLLEGELQKAASGGLIGYIKPGFMRKESIEVNLAKARAEVDGVNLKFNYLKMEMEAEVRVEIPLIKWSSPDGKTVFVNQKGQIFDPPADLVALFNPLEIAGAGLGSEVGSNKPVSPEKLAWIVVLVPALKEGGVEPSKASVVADSLKTIEVSLPDKQTRLIFSTEEDPGRSGVAAAKAVKYLEKSRAGGVGSLLYVDVRTPERVVYR